MAYRLAVPQYQGNRGDFSNYYIDNENSFREKTYPKDQTRSNHKMHMTIKRAKCYQYAM